MSEREEYIGNSRRNLVLKTAGIIRVLVGDKYYDINFRDDNKEIEQDKNDSKSNVSDFIIAQNINAYKNNLVEYPGDGKIIFTLTGDIYYTKDYNYYKYGSNENSNIVTNAISSIFNETVHFKSFIPFSVENNNLIQNLNAQYLDGRSCDEFVLNDANLILKNIIVDSISTKDGLFSYKNGVLIIPENNFVLKNISETVKIGSFNIKDCIELEYSKMIPYENTLLDEIIEYIEKDDNIDYSIVSSMIEILNSNDVDLSVINNLRKDDQLSVLNSIKDVVYAIPNDSLFDELKKNIVDVNLLPFNKSSYVLIVDSVAGISIYDKFKIQITRSRYIDKDGNYTYNSCEGSYFDEYTIDVNCIVTKINGDRISITTDYESKIYKYQIEEQFQMSFYGSIIDYTLNYIPTQDNDEYEMFRCFSDEYISKIDLDCENIIGLLNEEEVYGEKLSGYGLIIRNNGYFLNSKIYTSNISESNICNTQINSSNIFDCNVVNKFEFINISDNQEYFIKNDKPGNYSIKSNGLRASLLNSDINGLIVNIYAIDDLNINIAGEELFINANTYNSFVNIPISNDEYKWINIK